MYIPEQTAAVMNAAEVQAYLLAYKPPENGADEIADRLRADFVAMSPKQFEGVYATYLEMKADGAL